MCIGDTSLINNIPKKYSQQATEIIFHVIVKHILVPCSFNLFESMAVKILGKSLKYVSQCCTNQYFTYTKEILWQIQESKNSRQFTHSYQSFQFSFIIKLSLLNDGFKILKLDWILNFGQIFDLGIIFGIRTEFQNEDWFLFGNYFQILDWFSGFGLIFWISPNYEK